MNELVTYFDRIRERTMRVVACVPPDRIDWTYKEGKFTFGDVMRHLASIERWMFAENAMLRPSHPHAADLRAHRRAGSRPKREGVIPSLLSRPGHTH